MWSSFMRHRIYDGFNGDVGLGFTIILKTQSVHIVLDGSQADMLSVIRVEKKPP